MFDVILFTLSVSPRGRDLHKVAGYDSELKVRAHLYHVLDGFLMT